MSAHRRRLVEGEEGRLCSSARKPFGGGSNNVAERGAPVLEERSRGGDRTRMHTHVWTGKGQWERALQWASQPDGGAGTLGPGPSGRNHRDSGLGRSPEPFGEPASSHLLPPLAPSAGAGPNFTGKGTVLEETFTPDASCKSAQLATNTGVPTSPLRLIIC